jgi:hypothetical protein
MAFFRNQQIADTAHGSEYRIVVGQGTPIESAPLIENVVADDEVVAALYEATVWQDFGIEKLDFGGGVYGISLPMLLQVPVEKLKDVKIGRRKLGMAKAKELHDICAAHMRDEPHY